MNRGKLKKQIKAYSALALTLVMCVTIISCNGCASFAQLREGAEYSDVFSAVYKDIFGEGSQVYYELTVSLPQHANFTPSEYRQGYSSLTTENQRTAYKSMEESIFQFTNEGGGKLGYFKLKNAKIPRLTSAEIFMVKEAVFADHPEAFWLYSNYSLSYNFRDGDFITLYTTCDYNTAVKRVRALENAVTEYLSLIPSSATEYGREKIIHDKLVFDCDYDESAYNADTAELSDMSPDLSSAYGALVNHKAICGGYNSAMKLLLRQVGIDCGSVLGKSDGIGHVWNTVKIEGEWYHLDATWNDPIAANSEFPFTYNYFNLTTKEISFDHEISGGFDQLTDEIIKSEKSDENYYNFPLPECTADTFNFFKKEAVLVSSLNRKGASQITSKMTESAKEGELIFYVMFDENINPQQAYTWLMGNNSALETAMTDTNKSIKNIGRIEKCSVSYRADSSETIWANVFGIKITIK